MNHGMPCTGQRLSLIRAVGTEFAKVKKADGCHLGVYNKSKAIDYLTENGQKESE